MSSDVSITKQSLNEYLNQVRGSISEGWDALARMGRALLDQATEYSQSLVVAATAFVDGAPFTQTELFRAWEEMKGQQFSFLGNYPFGVNVLFTYDAMSNPLILLRNLDFTPGNNHEVALYESDGVGGLVRTKFSPSEIADTLGLPSVADAQNLVAEVLQAKGITSALGEIASASANMGEMVSYDRLSGLIGEMGAELSSIPQSWISALKSAASIGPTNLVLAFESLLSSCRNQAVRQNTDSGFSTTVEFKTYSPSALVQAIGTAVTITGGILSAFNAIIGVVLSAVGTLISVATSVVNALEQGVSGTNYTINSNQVHMFDYVLAKAQVFIPVETVELYGYPDAFVLEHKQDATFIMCCINRADRYGSDDEYYVMEYEVHLSTDFNAYSGLVSTTGLGRLRIDQHWYDAIGFSGVPIIGIPDSQTPGGAFLNVNGELSEALQSWYDPITYSIADRMKSFFSDQMSIDLAIRHASAIVVWAYAHLPMDAFEWNPNFGAYVIGCPYLTVGVGNYGDILFDNAGAMWYMLGAALSLIYQSAVVEDNSDYVADLQNVKLNHNAHDLLLSTVQKFANGIPCMSAAPAGTYVNVCFQFDLGTGVMSLVSTGVNVSTAYTYTLTTSFDYSKCFLINTWPTKAAVNLPSSLWTAYLANVFIDALVIVAIAAIAVTAIVVTTRLKRLAKQFRARADTATFNYGDGKISWAECRRANIIADIADTLCGRGQAASLGCSAFSSSSAARDVYTLNNVMHVITGE